MKYIVRCAPLLCCWALLCASGVATLAAAAELAPLSGIEAPDSAWRRAGLPNQTMPWTRFQTITLEGERVLQVRAEDSYGNLIHPVVAEAPPRKTLSWRWRLDEANAKVNLRQKAGDDAAVKVCAMFDLPLSSVPLLEQVVLRLARQRSAEPLPAATVCYLWDATLPAGTVLDNPFSRRVRVIVLRGAESPLKNWRSERRDLAADFLQLFGDEAKTVPALLAIAVGGDADNTHGRSLAHVADLSLQ